MVFLRYSWTASEVEEAQEASLLLAADVIYSDDLTDAFFSTIERLMCLGSEKVLVKALELPIVRVASSQVLYLESIMRFCSFPVLNTRLNTQYMDSFVDEGRTYFLSLGQ